MTEFLIYERLAQLEKEVHNLTQELEKALKDVEELKRRIADDDGK